MKSVTIWSKGTRMAGDLYPPVNQQPGQKYPVIVRCHGWSAPLKNVVRDTGLPDKLAAAGFFVLAFDYRGWGESDGIVVANAPLPQAEGETTMPVRIVRQVFDPVEWATDIQHALDFVEGEPGVDTERIGLWGLSLGGGLVIWTAVHDARVKCVFSQVGGHDYRGSDVVPTPMFPMWTRDSMRARAIEQARSPSYPLPPAEETRLRPGRRQRPLLCANRVRQPGEGTGADPRRRGRSVLGHSEARRRGIQSNQGLVTGAFRVPRDTRHAPGNLPRELCEGLRHGCGLV